ncbi:ribosomal silencing factor RsfS [Spirochaetia bacterium]|nr:ribosomal silencing factor RsfS [Spirochaetia bacterium]
MDDTLTDDKTSPLAVAQDLGALLREHNGGDVVIMDLRRLNSWTDFFVIATVTSHTHVQGLLRHIKEFARDRDLEILRRHRKSSPDDEWNLVDMGSVVIHLMSSKSRTFYELERLWEAIPGTKP